MVRAQSGTGHEGDRKNLSGVDLQCPMEGTRQDISPSIPTNHAFHMQSWMSAGGKSCHISGQKPGQPHAEL